MDERMDGWTNHSFTNLETLKFSREVLKRTEITWMNYKAQCVQMKRWCQTLHRRVIKGEFYSSVCYLYLPMYSERKGEALKTIETVLLSETSRLWCFLWCRDAHELYFPPVACKGSTLKEIMMGHRELVQNLLLHPCLGETLYSIPVITPNSSILSACDHTFLMMMKGRNGLLPPLCSTVLLQLDVSS